MSRWVDRIRALYWDWRDAEPMPRLRRPLVLQFPVNDICNSRCQMCHIWHRKRDHEISPSELSLVLSNPLFREVREIGLNGGEPTLRRDLPEIVSVVLNRLPRLRGVSLITNSIRAEKVIDVVDRLGLQCMDRGVHFDVMVSLDGIGEVHDRVRGVSGNFKSAQLVLEHVISSRFVSSARVGCTIVRDNVYDLENLLAFARAMPVYARFRIGIPHRRLYTNEIVQPFELDPDQVYHVAAFLDHLRLEYEEDPGRRSFYLSLRNQLVAGAPRQAGCAWKNRGVTLTSRGELAFCAVASPVLGLALHDDASRLHGEGKPILEQIVRQECRDCRHDYDGLAERHLFWERQIRRRLRRVPLIARPIAKIRRSLVDTRSARAAWSASRDVRPAARIGKAVLLCGWYGTETLGDKAILAGVTIALKSAGWDGAVDVASLEPYVTKKTLRELPELSLRRVLAVHDAESAIARGEYCAVVIAGGPLMSPLAEVYELLRLFRIASAAGIRTAVLGCGIGPLSGTSRRRRAISQLLAMSSIVVLRDRESLVAAEQTLGFRGNAEVAADPALIWVRAQTRLQANHDRVDEIVLALRDWPAHEYETGAGGIRPLKLKAQFERQLIVCVDTLADLVPAWRVRPIAMHSLSRGGDDRLFYQRVFAKRPEVLKLLSWKRRLPAEDLAAFASARSVLAMRFHSVVFAMGAGTPCVAIDYTGGGKTAAFLRTVEGAKPPLTLAEFDGIAAARSLVASTEAPTPKSQMEVESSYISAWRKILS